MLTLDIYTEFESKNDLAYALSHISELISEGYTAGGGWKLNGFEEPNEEADIDEIEEAIDSIADSIVEQMQETNKME